jgi:signal transduction histidine kinase
MEKPKLIVLLIEDDEDDYILVRDLLADIAHVDYEVLWAPTREQALRAMAQSPYDICLLDYRFGELDGMDLLREAEATGWRTPIIILTGYGNPEVDARALEAGAVDFLAKEELNAILLDRSIRYAVRQRQILERLRASEALSRRLSIDLLSVQEAERKRIAGELHDGVGQALAAAKFAVENGLQHMSKGNVPEAEATLARVVSILRTVSEETRRIQNDLQPRMLEDLGVVETLNWFCQEYQKTYTGIRIESSFAIREEEVPPELKATVFRIVQEAFNNIAKHSKADRVRLSFERGRQGLALTIRDNGRGFSPEEPGCRKHGMGLANMKGRAELSGGTFTIKSEPGKGTSLFFDWPCQL